MLSCWSITFRPKPKSQKDKDTTNCTGGIFLAYKKNSVGQLEKMLSPPDLIIPGLNCLIELKVLKNAIKFSSITKGVSALCTESLNLRTPMLAAITR